jgi:hypothetical protein
LLVQGWVTGDIVMVKIARVQTLVVRDGFGGDGAKKQIPLCVSRLPNCSGKENARDSVRDDTLCFLLRALDRRALFFAELSEGFALFC